MASRLKLTASETFKGSPRK